MKTLDITKYRQKNKGRTLTAVALFHCNINELIFHSLKLIL